MNICFFLLLLGGAWVFDFYRTDEFDIHIQTEQTNQTEHSFAFFYSPVNTLSIKCPVQKVLVKKNIQSDASHHLMLHHSSRAFHILKAEKPDLPDKVTHRNLTAFRNYHFTNLDDIPHSL